MQRSRARNYGKIGVSEGKSRGFRMPSDIIFDIGAFRGEDAEFYLRKGFRVLSVEANPEFADNAKDRNAKELSSGAYTVLNVALSTEEGVLDFHVHQHPDWSSLVKNWRFTEGTFKTIQIEAIKPERLFEQFGVPYYIKIDIEGLDGAVVDAVCGLKEKPAYVSYEYGKTTTQSAQKLAANGYDKFCLVPQRTLPSVRLPNPPREGKYVDFTFTLHNSGPFGKEIPGDWVSLAGLEEKLRTLDTSRGLGEWWDVHAGLAHAA